jgi:hypothetical protein
MSIWIILSWVFVLILTAINAVVFFKLKQASEQMMQMAFPGSKNMNEAMARMQQMMQGANRGPMKGAARGGGPQMDAQLRAAMDMLQKMQKGGKR